MDNYIEQIFINSGWYPKRKINSSEVNLFWKKIYGYSFIESINFFEEFGDLELRIKKYNKYDCIVNTSPESIIVSPYAIELCNNYLNTKLLPIGFIYGDNNFLLINHHGELFQYIDEYISEYEDNFPNLIYDFINGKTNDLIWNEMDGF